MKLFQLRPTKNSQHHAVFKNFHGAWAYKVDGLQSISLTQQVLPRSTERGFDVQRQRPEAAPAGTLKKGQLQDFLVQVHSDVRTQLVWKVFQKLSRWKKKSSWGKSGLIDLLCKRRGVFFPLLDQPEYRRGNICLFNPGAIVQQLWPQLGAT